MSPSEKDLRVLVDNKLTRSQEGLPVLPARTLEHSDCPAKATSATDLLFWQTQSFISLPALQIPYPKPSAPLLLSWLSAILISDSM